MPALGTVQPHSLGTPKLVYLPRCSAANCNQLVLVIMVHTPDRWRCCSYYSYEVAACVFVDSCCSQKAVSFRVSRNVKHRDKVAVTMAMVIMPGGEG